MCMCVCVCVDIKCNMTDILCSYSSKHSNEPQ